MSKLINKKVKNSNALAQNIHMTSVLIIFASYRYQTAKVKIPKSLKSLGHF